MVCITLYPQTQGMAKFPLVVLPRSLCQQQEQFSIIGRFLKEGHRLYRALHGILNDTHRCSNETKLLLGWLPL